MDYKDADRWLMGEAWVGSRLGEHLQVLCDDIGVRWAGSPEERAAADYVAAQFTEMGLNDGNVESFNLITSWCESASLSTVGDKPFRADVRPSLFCPSVNLTAPLIDVGFGMPHEVAAAADQLRGAVALVQTDFEPFSEPVHFTLRLRELARHGAVAAITPAVYLGRRLQHMSANDWRDGDVAATPLPLVQTSREDAGRLRRQLGDGLQVHLQVDARPGQGTSWNALSQLEGGMAGRLLLGAHHDTTPDSFGGNDNAAGVAVMLETARLLTSLPHDLLPSPLRTIQFASFGAEEQGLQGSSAYVERHKSEGLPDFVLALDELATGHIKGVVLQFPELRGFIQGQLDSMQEGLKCHVLSQLDSSGDMFPFSLQAVPTSFLWRWRFFGKHSETTYGHSSSDTFDKVRIRELKEYVGMLSRIFLRLATCPDWPANELDANVIARRVAAESGAVFRVY